MLKNRSVGVLLAIVLLSSTTRSVIAQEEPELSPEEQKIAAVLQSLNYIEGPAELDLGRYGVVQIPELHRGLNMVDARKYMEAFGNPPSQQLGLVLAPEGQGWIIEFEFDDVGYVEDDEKDDIDADELLEALREGQKAGNEERRRLGLDTLELQGWSQKPQYDESLKALTWATRYEVSSGGESVNHNIRLLGRKGVMTANLICSPVEYATAKSGASEVVKSFHFKAGERYDDFRKGDKIAEYGLKGLILGGGLAVALKTGLLQKFWKFIVAGLLALVALGKRMFGISSKPKASRRSGRRVRGDSAETGASEE